MQLIFERSKKNRKQSIFPASDVEITLPDMPLRSVAPKLPNISENELGRHYTTLAKQAHGVNNGFYPLGSCTMKHNPFINEKVSALSGFTDIHPCQPLNTVSGAVEAMNTLKTYLCEITGMDDITLQSAGGAQGEFTGILLIKAYHQSKGDFDRTEIIVPDSAHGTNPASAAMAGFKTIVIKSNEKGMVDIDDLKAHLSEKTAGLMLTNPNTLGIFDDNIMEITRLVHDAGGLCYYDGANLNAVIGKVRPGDIGFDVIHLNLHKTFSTPHGGGGPGSGPCGCKDFLKEFLPGQNPPFDQSNKDSKSIGDVTGFFGNFMINIRALAYILTYGSDGIPTISENAVLNANYMMEKLKDIYPVAYDRTCMHEFVLGLSVFHENNGVSALDIAKSLLDFGIHPPTMYFPLIVKEALMIEPTETESRETLDEAIDAFRKIYEKIVTTPDSVRQSPVDTPIKRLDEVKAAREPVLKYDFN